MEVIVVITGYCPICGKFVKRGGNRQVKTLCCCVEHRNLHMKETMKGENNPNFGNRWDDETRRKLGEQVKHTLVAVDRDGNKCRMSLDDERYLSGEWVAESKGRKFSDESRVRMSDAMKGCVKPPMSDETKAKIGRASKSRMTDPSHLTRMRRTNEERGTWIPLSSKTDYEVYFFLSDWQERMIDYASDEELTSLKQYGIFNPFTNKGGLVRDHKYSRWDGFVEGVFPEILSHPVNCAFIGHKDNVSKRSSSSLSLIELFELIEQYEGTYPYHKETLTMIDEYRQGGRWRRDD